MRIPLQLTEFRARLQQPADEPLLVTIEGRGSSGSEKGYVAENDL
jgi:hypothetical protein